jgi:amino acid adenylation domain-containing protein
MHAPSRGPACAIVGIGCRFPGRANSPDEFWELLCGGIDAIREIPGERFDIDRFYDPDPSRPGRLYARRAGLVDDAGGFDAAFFGISRREAAHIDPQQRLLLEVAWEALEDAGIPLPRLSGTLTGVFVGLSSHDFASMLVCDANRHRIDAHTISGTAPSIAANRVSYAFDLRGPSLAVDTACSSSLTAVHLACRSLAAGECDLALAGGVNLYLAPETAITMAKASMLSPDGRSKAFDASADGYVRGEGAGVVLLKPLDAALRDGDRVYAAVRATAINQDGRTVGMTVPSVDAQASMMRAALREAGFAPGEVQYVEAHGTGTPTGDPVEAAAIGRVFGAGRDPSKPCLIGSVKTNIGHLEAGAGIAGLIKTALALNHRAIPPSLHFHTPNPAIPFQQLGIRVATALEAWPGTDGPAVAGVNSFGLGGANAHALLEQAPVARDIPEQAEEIPRVLLLSAKTPESLREAARRQAAFLGQRQTPLQDVCYTAAVRRTHHPHRLAVVAGRRETFRSRLDDFARDSGSRETLAGCAPRPGQPKVAFLYSGMGLQRPGMGKDLFPAEPVFREVLERCDRTLSPVAGWSVLEAMHDGDPRRTEDPEVAQVTNFALQAALTALWRSWGVIPDAVAGHSVGEVAAAHAAGVLSLEDGLMLAWHRGRLARRVSGQGAMLAAAMTAESADRAIDHYDARITLAAINSPASVTLTGDRDCLADLAQSLEKQGSFCRFVPVTVPYHSRALDPLRSELIGSLCAIAPLPPAVPMVSSTLGDWVNGNALGADHWWSNFRHPVQFARAVRRLLEHGVELFLEIGPHASLRPPVEECLAHGSHSGVILSSLRRGDDDREVMLRSAAALHTRGRNVDWPAMFRGRGRCVSLPAYPWQHENFGTGYHAETGSRLQVAGAETGHPLLGARLPSAHPCWHASLAGPDLRYLEDHLVQDAPVFPAAAYVEMSLAAARELSPGAIPSIERLEFRKMLVLPKDRAAAVQWTSNPSGEFEILAKPDNQDSWTPHASGRLRTDGRTAESLPLDLEAVRARCGRPVRPADWYDWCQRRGLAYRGTFRGVEALWQGCGEALARVRMAAGARRYQIHPALLDSAFQVAGAAAGAGSRQFSGTLLPSSIAAVRRYGPAGTSLWAYVKLRSEGPDAFETDIHLLDDEGKEVLTVECLRCVLIPAAADANEHLLYRIQWQEHSPGGGASLPGGEATARAWRAAPELAAQSGIGDYYPLLEESLNRLAAAYIHATLRRLGSTAPVSLHQRYFERWRQLARDMPVADIEGCRCLASALSRNNPRWTSVVNLVVRSGESLSDLLTGKLEPQEVLFGQEALADLVEFYRDTPFFSYYHRVVGELVGGVAQERHAGARLRVLEVGAGTGGATSSILPRLPEGAADYVFTDVSPFFLSHAKARFSDRPDVRFALLDIEAGPAGDALPHDRFDVIVAADVLHATGDLARSLANARSLLAPGGWLVLVEPSRPIPWVDLIFGLFPGWWRFAGHAIRTTHPLLSRERWMDLLRQAGFENVEALPQVDSEGLPPQTVIAARRSGADTSPAVAMAAGEWLIVADAGGAARKVAEALARRGARPVLIDSHEPVPAGDASRWAGIVYLPALDQPPLEHLTPGALVDFQAAACQGVVDLLRSVVTHRDQLPAIWLLTAAAQVVVPEDAAPNAPQAVLWGLGRVLASEFPNARCHLADLGPEPAAREIELLADAILGNDPEDELAFRGGRCFAARVAMASAEDFRRDEERVVPVSSAQVRLEVTAGSLDSLSLREVRPIRPGPRELLVRVRAAGLNFRDIMLALGLMPVTDPAIDSRLPLGLECAGVVVEVGSQVHEFAPGDEVLGVTHGAFASHAMLKAAAAVRKPAWLDWYDAGGVLAPFTTVQHSLYHLARVAPGERVLIHSATGGVGLAAIQFCRAAGAEMFATAGSPEKRDLLRAMGIAHVMDSRTLAFADQILEATGGEGLDVVLNSLPGEAISKGLSILRSGGRFIELGKRDLMENSSIALGPFKRTLAFFSVDLELMFRKDTARLGKLSAEVIEAMEAGRFKPLPRTDFPLPDAAAAFRLMSQARHTGKIVLTADGREYRARPTRAQWLFRRDATYLITGGLGGFALAAAGWMVSQGARHLVLMGRRDAPLPENEAAWQDLLRGPAKVRCVAGDVSKEADVVRVLATIRAEMPPLGGVLHAAMVLEDGALLDLTPQQWRTVLMPKVAGAWLLDRLTASDDLDCFVLFSSAASIVGTPGQGAYAAANAFLDALASRRRARGRPGLSVCWGPIEGAGYVSRHPEVRQYLERVGFRSFGLDEALGALEQLWRADRGQGIAGRVHWADFRRAFPSRRRFESLPGDGGGRGAGPAISPAGSVAAELLGAEPAGRREAACRYVVRRVAGVLTESESRIDPEVPLTNLGLDSLMAVELQTLFHSDLGLRIAATRLLQGISARELAELVLASVEGEAAALAPAPSPHTAEQPRRLPLASEQRRLWFLQQLHPASPIYNVPLSVRFSGALDASLLHRALVEIARRHEALRATFAVENGEPVQIIAPEVEIGMAEVDLTSLAAAGQACELLRLKRSEALLPFDLAKGPLIRARLIRLGPGEHVLLLTLHHLIVDAFSVPVIAREHAAIYQGLVGRQSHGLPAAPDYSAYIARQQKAGPAADQLAYWKRKLAGTPPLRLPADRPHPPQRTFAGERLEFAPDGELFDRLDRLGRSEGATLFMTLLAAFQSLLYRYSRQGDFAVGVPVATRAREEATDLVGCLVNSLALRANVSGEMTFRDLLRGVRATVLEAYENQDASWEDVVQAVDPDRDPSRPPIFQVLLVVHHTALQQVEFPGMVMAPEYVGNRSTTFDLVLLVDAARREAAFEYNTDIFDAPAIERMSRHLARLLAGIAEQPDCPVRELPLLTDAERRQVICPAAPEPAASASGGCLHQLFQQQARRAPDAVAVVSESRSLTYGQLDRAANRIAAMLRERGVGPETLVAICAGRSPLAIAGIVGILEAGGAFVPLDPRYPQDRLAFMLRDSAPRLLLIDPRLAGDWSREFAGVVLPLDLDELLAAEPAPPPEAAAAPANLAYVMYTSGSTGLPKGVMVEHRSIVNQVLWRQQAFPLYASDAVLQTTSLSFDPSVWEIFGPLSAGAAVAIPEGPGGYDGAALNRLMRLRRITVLEGVPSTLRSLLDQHAFAGCESLRHVFVGGEPLQADLLDEMVRATGAAVHHLYGCTETAIDSTCLPRVTPGQSAATPIGRPIANTRVYVLDNSLQPLPAGVPGELYVGGAGVARGYLNRPELTRERFPADPFQPGSGARLYRTGDLARLRADGNFELLGRADRQIKLRGMRLEPAEIEAPLREHPAVRGVVVGKRDASGSAGLVAWVALKPGRALTPAEAAAHLAPLVPRCMIPNCWVFLDALPVTPDGKVDFAALPDPLPAARPASAPSAPPATPLERRIAAIWEEMLAARPIGVWDNFFDLGGHSLMAARLAARLGAELGVEVPLSTILAAPTIAEFSAEIGGRC